MTIGTLERDGLIAGDYPLKVEEVTVHGAGSTGRTEFKRGDVVALITGANGETPTLVDSRSAVSGANRAVGIMAEPVSVGPGEQTVTVMFIKGEFNRRFLQFGGNDTYDIHKRRMTEIGLLVRETRI